MATEKACLYVWRYYAIKMGELTCQRGESNILSKREETEFNVQMEGMVLGRSVDKSSLVAGREGRVKGNRYSEEGGCGGWRRQAGEGLLRVTVFSVELRTK